jgi:hypothetical protein
MSLHDEPIPLSAVDRHENWDSLLIGGNNGIICIVFSLYWWGCSLKPDQIEEYKYWMQAVKDVDMTFGACLAA